jgi:hypothetical protein
VWARVVGSCRLAGVGESLSRPLSFKRSASNGAMLCETRKLLSIHDSDRSKTVARHTTAFETARPMSLLSGLVSVYGKLATANVTGSPMCGDAF